MIKPFAALVVLLALMVTSMTLHYIFYPSEKTISALRQITVLTQITPLSLSIAYDEANYNSSYPEMQGLGRMGFIYEQ